jgi:hypothetical protein
VFIHYTGYSSKNRKKVSVLKVQGIRFDGVCTGLGVSGFCPLGFERNHKKQVNGI